MNLPNRITILRVILTIFFVASLLYYVPGENEWYRWAVAFFFSACLTDGLDGYLARKLHQKTEFGALLDPVADKFLLLSGFLSLSLIDGLPPAMHVPAWVTLPILARDIVLLIGSVIIFILTGRLTARPIFIGKLTTVMQMITLSASLLMFPEGVRLACFTGVVCLTAVSAMVYISLGGRIMQDS